MAEYNLKHYAYIGDAVWELFIRELVILKTQNQKQMHNLTIKFVNADFQAEIFDSVKDFLNEEEIEIAKRARNLPITINKRNNPILHRIATSFEVLIGYFYLNDKEKLNNFFEIVKKNLKI